MNKKEKAKAHLDNIVNTAVGITNILGDDKLTDFGRQLAVAMVAKMGEHNAYMIAGQPSADSFPEGGIVLDANTPKGERVLSKDHQESLFERLNNG